jgi:hypothetical protein
MGKQRRKKTGGRNKYIDREEHVGDAPDDASEENAGDDAAVTQKEFGLLVKEVETITESIGQLVQALGGSEKTPAQSEEITERQLADATKINERNARKSRVIPIFGADAGGGEDLLFKGVHEGMTKKEAKSVINQVIASKPDSDLVREFQKRSDRIKMRCDILGKRPEELQMWDEHEAWLEKTGIDKVLNISGAATDFIPEGWSMETRLYYYQALKLGSAFEEFPMTASPENFPLIGRPTAHHHSRAASNRGVAANEYVASDPTEGVTTFTARTLSVRVDLEEEYVEDSADTLDTVLEQALPHAMARGVESALVNGSRQATHQDNNFQVATSPVEKAWDGLRRVALERAATLDIEASSGAFGFDDFSRLIELGGHYLIHPDDCCWVLSNAVYTKSMRFSQLETWDKNPMPTNINGVIGMILGRPVVVSGEYPLTLHTDGTNDSTATNNVKTGFSLFNKMQFMIGNRRAERTEQFRDPLTGFYYLVTTARKDFQTMENRRGGYTPCVSAINITTAS